MITDHKCLGKLLNERLKSEKIVSHNEDFDKRIVLHNIIKKYENHSSIIKTKKKVCEKSFEF